MAVTKGHGNPNWTRDETILALNLYFEFDGQIPSSADEKIIEISELLRSFPHHSMAARKESFRNADGVAFKLQNLRQVATGKGLGNTSKMDRQVWEEFGNKPDKIKKLSELIRAGIELTKQIKEDDADYESFAEGRVVTETHLRRERDPKLRKRLLESREKSWILKCDMCACTSPATSEAIQQSMFEAHHILPLSESGERITKLEDMALLCANCHRMLHKAITSQKKWLTISEGRSIVLGDKA